MVIARVIAVVMAAGLLTACDQPMSSGQKGALGGAAIGTGIGLATGGSFGAVVGGGLIGGGAGYLLGTAVGNR
ncbi:MAG TPA: bacteriocin [Reyranella sp.]|nr:bacteriocin [Reyranella sp.]